MQLKKFLSFFLGIFVCEAATSSIYSPGGIPFACGSLVAATHVVDQLNIVTDALDSPMGRSRENRLRILEELVSAKNFRESLEQGSTLAVDTLNKVVDVNGDIEFYNRAKEIFAREKVTTKLDVLDDSHPPQGTQLKSDFQNDVFEAGALSDKSKLKLLEFMSHDETLKSRSLTRRTFAFLAKNNHLSAQEKINFIKNLWDTFMQFQKDKKLKEGQYVYDDLEYKSTDGNKSRIFCGHNCSYYFVVTLDGSCYAAKSQHTYMIDSRSDVLRDWRRTAEFVYKAGEEEPYKENFRLLKPIP